MIEAIHELEKHGIDKVIVLVSHGLFSGLAIERINKCDQLVQVITTNSVPQDKNIEKCGKLEEIDIAPFLSNIIGRIVTGESLSVLFD